MAYQVNLHAPPGINDFRTLAPDDFVTTTKHEAGLTTTDVYYQPKFAQAAGKKENFLSKLSGIFERLKGFKPATESYSLREAFRNILSDQSSKNMRPTGYEANYLSGMMHDLALKPRDADALGYEKSNNGTTFTLVNWDEQDRKNYDDKLTAPEQKGNISDDVAMNQDPDRIEGVVRLFKPS